MSPITAPWVRSRKRSHGDAALVMITAYDEPSARLADAAGVDLILVGDSVANVVLGHEDTLQVTTEQMAHHVGAVARAKPQALIVGDLPWMSYHVSVLESLRNAASLIRAGAGCVKLEGGQIRVETVRKIVEAEIPVMGHLGLTPQSVHAQGGYRVQGKTADAAQSLLDDARALEAAGCFAIVLEGIPAIVLFGPLLFPIARAVGIHEVHYAMVVILAMGIGLFAPPLGVGYYAACAIGRVSPDAGMRRIWPYLGALMVGLLAVAAIPWLSVGFL